MGKILAAAVAALVLTGHLAAAEDWNVCLRKNGNLYRIGPEFRRQSCRTNETPATLNTEGPAGPTGPQGEPGEQGPPGASLTAASFYHLNWTFEVARNSNTFFGVGCSDPADVAIAGGPDLLNASGGAIYWTTLENRPDVASKDSWGSRVLYTGPQPTATFLLTLKCLDLP